MGTSLTLLLGLGATACLEDSVPPDIYSTSPDPGATPQPSSMSSADPAAPEREPTPTPPPRNTPSAAPPTAAASSAAEASSPPVAAGVTGCDLRGQWLITQRTIASGLGVKTRAAWWFYYEIDQSGSDLSITRGLVCGSQVYPVDPLSAAVDFAASFPALIANNSHAGRHGSAVLDGDDCRVSFERAVIVVGATTPFYADENNPLPALEQRASDTSPGWEDWDEDGNPAVTLHVSGLVEGSRYTALRAFSEWSGTIPADAASFELPVTDWGQEEAVLGVTADVLKQTGVPDADRSGHFAEFARLEPAQIEGDPETACASVRRLAPTLTPNANR